MTSSPYPTSTEHFSGEHDCDVDFSFDYSGSDVIDCSFGDGATLTAGRRPSTTSRGVSTSKTPHTAVASDLLQVRDELSDESSLTKVKVTAGPAKVRTLGTFLAELLVREEFLSFPVASDGGEHYKVRKYLNFALIISLPERIPPFAVQRELC